MLCRVNLVVVAITAALVVTAASQPCADWSTTMPPPVVFPGLGARTIHMYYDYTIGAGPGLSVWDLDDTAHPVVGSCDLPDYGNLRIREVDGEVFAVCGTSGVFCVNLSDPSEPVATPVFAPGDEIRDLAGFDGGVILVAASGTIIVVDRLIGGPVGVLARIEGTAGLWSVTANSTRAWIAGHGGVAGVDLSEPTDPVVGDWRFCDFDEDEEHWNLDRWFYDVAFQGDVLYTAALYGWDYGDGRAYQAFSRLMSRTASIQSLRSACRSQVWQTVSSCRQGSWSSRPWTTSPSTRCRTWSSNRPCRRILGI